MRSSSVKIASCEISSSAASRSAACGSTEPSVQLKGAADEQQQRQSTEQIAAATEDNLKKIAGRPLDTGQQQTLSQVKQFMEQSKAAIAEGDVERGHDLAMKARLLSDELIKP